MSGGLVLTLVVTALVAPTAAGAAIPFPDTERISADGAVGVGIAISQRMFGDGAADAVILTRDDKFPDGLAASALAGEKNAPILFTGSEQLDARTRAELERVLPNGGRVYLMGGTEALSQDIETAVGAAGYQPTRINGETRIDTAAITAQTFVGAGPGDTAFLARGFGRPGQDLTQGWVDAVSCGGYAARTGTPILLTNTNQEQLPERTVTTLQAMGVTRVYICGGVEAVPISHQSQLAEMGIRTDRYAGDTRVTTAIDVAKRLWGAGASTDGDDFLLVHGFATNFAYGLAAAPLSGVLGAPMLLVNTDDPSSWPLDCGDLPTLASATPCYLHGDGDDRVGSLTLVGSTRVVTDAVFEAVATAAGIPKDTQPPTVPAGVTATDTPEDDGTNVAVSWDASTDDSGGSITYTVYAREAGDDAMTTGNASKVGSVTDATQLTVPGLTAGTEYQFAVTATDSYGRTSALSDPATATPTDEVPAAPASAPERQNQPPNVLVFWSEAPEADVEGYQVERMEDMGNACDENSLLNILNGGYDEPRSIEGRESTTFTDETAESGTDYCYRYAKVDTTGNVSPPSPPVRVEVG